MSFNEIRGDVAPIWLWTDPTEVESQALDQLKNVAKLPWIHHHVAVMPDVHFGKGATVGSVIAMRDAVSPSAVGVDIGCGMRAVRTNLTAADLPDDLGKVRAQVEKAIPVGNGPGGAAAAVTSEVDVLPLWGSYARLHPKVQGLFERARRQLGTLGGGNHFIELQLDTDDRVWLMLHSGSRNIGKSVADVHIGIAKTLDHNNGLADPDLAVFLAGTPEMTAYRHDLMWAQEYARLNRALMMDLYIGALRAFFPHLHAEQTVQCHHNYVSEERHFDADVLVTRKGAISARDGEWGIIPGSMGTGSYIVRGLGNPDSFTSASHGAGRRMSRNAARKTFTVEDLAEQTAGVECRKDPGVIDEIPGAYKDVRSVIDRQRDLVEVEATLRAVMCVKG
jgi:tRNA-splicing ligase RtcB (3'-phosphate/5'-hydroxy nucleic acid ligase)